MTVICRKRSPWAIADGASDASQAESNNGSASPNRTRQSDHPGLMRQPRRSSCGENEEAAGGSRWSTRDQKECA